LKLLARASCAPLSVANVWDRGGQCRARTCDLLLVRQAL
jgi:hypothetical protein